jgi:hypothetical protein
VVVLTALGKGGLCSPLTMFSGSHLLAPMKSMYERSLEQFSSCVEASKINGLTCF